MAKALFILFKDYSKTHDGGSQANMRNLNIAKQILGEDNVDCYYIHDVNRKRSLLSMLYVAILFPFGYFNGLTPQKVREILGLSDKYEYVFITNSIFGIVGKRLKENRYKGKVISFFHNVESIYYNARVNKRMPFRNIIIGCAAKNDRYALEYADTSVGLCERDSDSLKDLHGKGFDLLAPISFKDKGSTLPPPKEVLTGKRPKCTFIGSNFPANANGILWFVRNVLPHVDIDFTIVGQNMDKLKAANECLKEVEVHSNVPDIAPFFTEADFMIYPIFDGSGMKVKTCEALMYGKNILGTTETFEGYDVNPDKCGRLCNTADEYIAALRNLSENPVKIYNDYSRSVFVEKYSEESSISIFKKIFNV